MLNHQHPEKNESYLYFKNLICLTVTIADNKHFSTYQTW